MRPDEGHRRRQPGGQEGSRREPHRRCRAGRWRWDIGPAFVGRCPRRTRGTWFCPGGLRSFRRLGPAEARAGAHTGRRAKPSPPTRQVGGGVAGDPGPGGASQKFLPMMEPGTRRSRRCLAVAPRPCCEQSRWNTSYLTRLLWQAKQAPRSFRFSNSAWLAAAC